MNKRQYKKKVRNSGIPYTWYVCYDGNCTYNSTGESCKFHTCKLYKGYQIYKHRYNIS